MDSDWLGSDGYDCGAWTVESCAKDGAVIMDDNGVTAKDGCCVCGGGSTRQCSLVKEICGVVELKKKVWCGVVAYIML